MKVLNVFPPNYAAINKAFKVRGKPVIFAYGGTIYNPSRMVIAPQLYAHEAVHLERQGADPSRWWERYIEEPVFRLEEEIPAHVAEYRDACERGQQPHEALEAIAGRLASPLYGKMIGLAEARAIVGA